MNLKKAAADPHIKAVVMQPEGISAGWAKLEEIRTDLEKFRKSGKPVFAYLRAPGTREYYLALAADRIYLGPPEPLMLKGLRAEMMYFKKTLDKIGVSVEVEHAGKYKDFGDMFTRTDMSPETREVMTSVVDDLYGNLVDGIAAARKKIAGRGARDHRPGPVHRAAGAEGGAGGRAALRRPDVGRTEGPAEIGRPDEGLARQVHARCRRTRGTAGRATSRWWWARATSCAATRATTAPDETSLTSYGFNKLLKQVENDSMIKGVVVRIDSPGGEVTAIATRSGGR